MKRKSTATATDWDALCGMSAAEIHEGIEDAPDAQATDEAFFTHWTPNVETITAMKAARRGELVTVGSPENLLVSLNADG